MKGSSRQHQHQAPEQALGSASRRFQRRWPRPRRRSRLIEAIAILHGLAAARPASGRSERRRIQQLSIAQRLLDPLPPSLRPRDASSDLFWQGLRWGGLGLVLARLLTP